MKIEVHDALEALTTTTLVSRDEALGRPSAVPAAGGVYAWWFRTAPWPVDVSRCVTRDQLTLLYVGISPKEPPANGRAPSKENLQRRIRTHYAGNAEGSTLRRTLGCLLADELGIELRRVGSGSRMTFVDGEPVLSNWMGVNAFVSWVPYDRPWELERDLLGTVDLPLNLEGNLGHLFHPELSRIRSAAFRRARDLPVVANPGIGGRHASSAPRVGQFVAQVVNPSPSRSPVARLVLTGAAASASRQSVDSSREMLVAGLRALSASGASASILLTPAGFVDIKRRGSWHGHQGWDSTTVDFKDVAETALAVVDSLVTPAVRSAAAGAVDALIVGVDVWPTAEPEPYAEVACMHVFATGESKVVTGKSYPTSGQAEDLIRNPDVGSHVIDVGDERVAVLVCHDLAAWSPRGNAVAKGHRAVAWRRMQATVTEKKPTLAVQPPHTVDTAGTWRTSWAAFRRSAGPQLRSGTTVIRHLDRWYRPADGPLNGDLLAGTWIGQRGIDVVVAGAADHVDVGRTASVARAPATVRRTAASVPHAESADRGIGLARLALEVFSARAGSYRQGIQMGELAGELRASGHPIAGDDPIVTLRSALNASQVRGVWVRHEGGWWRPGLGTSKLESGLSGRALAEAIHDFVMERYPNRLFHYEKARVGLERTGVDVRGTGNTTRAALASASDLFEHVPDRRGWWQWK